MPVPVTGLTGVTSLSVGADAVCAFGSGGGVQCWGSNGQGQLGNVATTNVPGEGPCSLLPVPFTGLASTITTVSLGDQFACALVSGGGVQCWGSNASGHLGNGSAATNSSVPVQVTGLTSGVTALFKGWSDNACAITGDGGVECWGVNLYGELGNNSMVSGDVPVAIAGLTSGVVAVSTGGGNGGVGTICTLTSGGGVQCWGDNHAGQLGSGSSATQSSVPVQVTGLTSGATSVSVGSQFACTLTSSGGVLCWGDNTWGELGNGSTTNSSVPVPVTGLTSGVTAISAGASFACAVTAGGRIQCWGDDQYGQLGSSSTTHCPNGYPCSMTPVPVTGF